MPTKVKPIATNNVNIVAGVSRRIRDSLREEDDNPSAIAYDAPTLVIGKLDEWKPPRTRSQMASSFASAERSKNTRPRNRCQPSLHLHYPTLPLLSCPSQFRLVYAESPSRNGSAECADIRSRHRVTLL